MITADFQKLKSQMNYLKLELTSFIEDKNSSMLNNTFNQEKSIDILTIFPISNDEQLLAIENRLESDDLEYYNKLVNHLSI